MSTVELKNIAHSLIDSINDSETLNAIITLLNRNKEEEEDWWNELSEENKKSIERGLKDIEEGRVIPHDEVMARMKEKYPKHF